MIFHLRTVGNFSNGYTKKSGRTSLGRPQIPEKAGVKYTDQTKNKRDAQKRFQPKAQKKSQRAFGSLRSKACGAEELLIANRGTRRFSGPFFLLSCPPKDPESRL